MKIYIGSGSQTQVKKEQGFVTVDFDKRYNPDILWDLNKIPWPFPDNSIEYIEAFHVIEHMDSVDNFMYELWRICKHGAVVKLMYPHISRVLATGFGVNDKHRSAVPMRLLDRYSLDNEGKECWKFKYKKIKLEWIRTDIPPHPKSRYRKFTRFIWPITTFFLNLSLVLTDRIFVYWVGGIDNVILEAEVQKEGIVWNMPLQRKTEVKNGNI